MARQLRLADRAHARASLSRVIRDFDRDSAVLAGAELQAACSRFRAMVAGLSLLLSYDRAAEELDLVGKVGRRSQVEDWRVC